MTRLTKANQAALAADWERFLAEPHLHYPSNVREETRGQSGSLDMLQIFDVVASAMACASAWTSMLSLRVTTRRT